ncbi:phosphoglycerate kinase, putative [Perkinsus marinus ATCC 50983]|nr:phosphoglycerate kinase, putative [Perkinsus marinus ATCC 50983]EER17232.1 phosphoglycerate kinase, putative [Perkinsus marinus ATCC 50983]|eukprot:XP_002785436.1 phosphoglycerate kinase, putative [Perkinsus marinus ATCC 50983]
MLSSKLTLNNISEEEIKGKRVLMRVDFNVPIKEGRVADKTRIVKTIPTIKRVMEMGAQSIVLMSHLGRPQGQRKEEFSLAPVVPVLAGLLEHEVTFVPDCVGDVAIKACAAPAQGSIILLENLRFHIEEEGKGVNANGEKVKAAAEDVAA